MATKSISQLDTQATANETDLFEVAIVDQNSASGYASKKESAAAIADAIVGSYQYPLRITGTTAKTIAGAINELKNLVDLLPQFAIEVVQTLPVSDISETTIYLVPAQDPEQGNYYEEYIYVNQTWELVGTTAVDLSGYYTSAQTDTLLAAKANSADLATVATSGAYADLSGKPTIDTQLDTTSTNAVENRAIASEINSIKSDISVEGSASGDIASFVDGSANPLKELEISIEAVQSGTGDPSPTNVRPIIGFNAVGINRTGVNVWDEEWEVGGINHTTGQNTESTGVIRSKNYIGVKGNTNYNFLKKTNGIDFHVHWYDADKNFILYEEVYAGSINYKVTTSPQNAVYMRFNLTAGYGATYNNDISINYPSTDTAYHAYNGETINIDWQSVAGTVYGGQLNVKTGELTVTYAITDLGNLNYNYLSSENRFYVTDLANVIKRNEGALTLLSSIFKAVDRLQYLESHDNCIWLSAAGNVSFSSNGYTTAIDFRTAVTGQKLVYELATPVTYQLTPTEIRSLLGVNNIWADCGDITELKYTRDLNLCINDIISRIEALEGGSNSRSLSISPTLTKSLTSELDANEGKEEDTKETEEETKEEAQKNER